MAVRVRAKVKPEILSWARETAGYPLDEAAKKIGVKLERLASWEELEGDAHPTINQLRTMARVYKRPLSVFYLQETPENFAVMRDLRRLPGDGIRKFSPILTLEMRAAQERRELMLHLYEEIGETPEPFKYLATLAENPEDLGKRIRNILGVSYAVQSQWREPRLGFNYWRNQIEMSGVLVFQTSRLETSEVSGFAIANESLPLIAVNRKDVFTRRTFSLLHEFAHLVLNTTGVSDLYMDSTRPPEEQKIEVFCNAVAAAALIPGEDFLNEPIVLRYDAAPREWADNNIEDLALTYSVSREAIVRRLMTFNRATEDFYQHKREQYLREQEERQADQRELYKQREFRRNPARDTLTINGRPYVQLVLNTYYRERITLGEVSSFLGVRLKHLRRVEQYLGTG